MNYICLVKQNDEYTRVNLTLQDIKAIERLAKNRTLGFNGIRTFDGTSEEEKEARDYLSVE
jgi:hypothetical protein